MKIVQFNGHTYLLKDESFKEQPYNTKGCLDKHNIFCLGTTGYNRPRLECISGFCEDCHEIIASTRDIPNCEKLEVMDYPENFIVDNVGRKISIDGIYRNINEHHHALDMNELVQVTGFVLIDGHYDRSSVEVKALLRSDKYETRINTASMQELTKGI